MGQAGVAAFFKALGYLTTKAVIEEREMKKAEDNAPIQQQPRRTTQQRDAIPIAAVAPQAQAKPGFSFTWPQPK